GGGTACLFSTQPPSSLPGTTSCSSWRWPSTTSTRTASPICSRSSSASPAQSSRSSSPSSSWATWIPPRRAPCARRAPTTRSSRPSTSTAAPRSPCSRSASSWPVQPRFCTSSEDRSKTKEAHGMPLSSFSRRTLALHATLLALAGPATAANVSTTAELVQHNAIPLPLWLTIFGVALFLLLLSIRYNRPDGDPESAVLTASLALVFSGAATYLIGLVREVTYEIVPVVNATTGAV